MRQLHGFLDQKWMVEIGSVNNIAHRSNLAHGASQKAENLVVGWAAAVLINTATAHPAVNLQPHGPDPEHKVISSGP